MPHASAVEGSLLSQNATLGERLQRLSPVLEAMARDLAATRREAVTLRRENARLLAYVASRAREATSQAAVLCDRCGDAVPTRARGESIQVDGPTLPRLIDRTGAAATRGDPDASSPGLMAINHSPAPQGERSNGPEYR